MYCWSGGCDDNPNVKLFSAQSHYFIAIIVIANAFFLSAPAFSSWFNASPKLLLLRGRKSIFVNLTYPSTMEIFHSLTFLFFLIMVQISTSVLSNPIRGPLRPQLTMNLLFSIFPAQYIFFPPTPSLRKPSPKTLSFMLLLRVEYHNNNGAGDVEHNSVQHSIPTPPKRWGYIGLWREIGNLLNDEICLWIYFQKRKRWMGKFVRFHVGLAPA